MDDKIINTFQQRRQLALDMAELALTESELALSEKAREIVESYPETMIQAEILKKLDTPDSQLRGGLGQLAVLLTPSTIAPALRSMVADRNQSPQSRLTAAMLLTRYIGESFPQALLSDLNQSNDVAFESLREAVEEGKKNPRILIEYVTQMREAGDHIAPMVLDQMNRLPPEDRVDLLRVIALEDQEALALNALGRLELLASQTGSDESTEALYTLQHMVRPSLTNSVVDALRRLRFNGTVYRPGEPDDWYALIGVSDFTSQQTIWFIQRPESAEQEQGVETALLFSLNEYTGQFYMSAQDAETVDEVPDKLEVGKTITIHADLDRQTQLLVVPLDYARWRILETIPRHWESVGELPSDFKLYGDQLMRYTRPELDPELKNLISQDETVSDESEGTQSSDTPLKLQEAELAIWLRNMRPLFSIIPGATAPESDEKREALARAILTQWERNPENMRISEALADALRIQAAWYYMAGYQQAAEAALAFAPAAATLPLSENPLLLAAFKSELDALAGE